MAITYRILDDYTVEVQNGDGSWSAPTLNAVEAKQFDDKVWRWAADALSNEERTGLPAAFTLGVIEGESGGNPLAEGPPSDHGIGLMQITATVLKQGLSDEEVFDPATNIRLGVDALAHSASIVGYDLPKLASMYNAGGGAGGPHPSVDAPWGYREYKTPQGTYPYISRVVRTSNYAIQKMKATPPSTGFGIGLAVFLGSLFGLAVGAGIALGRR